MAPSVEGGLKERPCPGGEEDVSQTRRMGELRPLQSHVISGDGQYVAHPVQWVNDTRIRQCQVSTGVVPSLNCSAYGCNQPSLSGDGGHVAHVVFSGTSSGPVEDPSRAATLVRVGRLRPSLLLIAPADCARRLPPRGAR